MWIAAAGSHGRGTPHEHTVEHGSTRVHDVNYAAYSHWKQWGTLRPGHVLCTKIRITKLHVNLAFQRNLPCSNDNKKHKRRCGPVYLVEFHLDFAAPHECCAEVRVDSAWSLLPMITICSIVGADLWCYISSAGIVYGWLGLSKVKTGNYWKFLELNLHRPADICNRNMPQLESVHS